jgi:MoxR-like ATPase
MEDTGDLGDADGMTDGSAAAGVRPADPVDLERALAATGYLADGGLTTVAWLALAMERPLLLEGEPGTGKTALAEALAEALDAELVRLQCYEGIDAGQALYDWDFPRQVLHLRALEAARRRDEDLDVQTVESSLFDERFLLERPVLRALRSPNAVLLVDEIDRADDEFEAFLLEVLSTNAVTIPEFGTVRAEHPPLVVLTSNRTREVHDALKRRCLYHWIEHPGLAREVKILRRRLPDLPGRLADQVARAVHGLREGAGGPAGVDLFKPPGVAESLDWARCLMVLGRSELDVETAAATLGAVCKYREDADRVRESLARLLAG